MKLAIIGSRIITELENFDKYIPNNVTEIVTGGAKGVDTLAMEYAKRKGIKLTVFLPEYDKYSRAAPIIRNKQIVDYADEVYVFWDGRSSGTSSVIEYCCKKKKKGIQHIFPGYRSRK